MAGSLLADRNFLRSRSSRLNEFGLEPSPLLGQFVHFRFRRRDDLFGQRRPDADELGRSRRANRI
jgi:hypothetical protein